MTSRKLLSLLGLTGMVASHFACVDQQDLTNDAELADLDSADSADLDSVGEALNLAPTDGSASLTGVSLSASTEAQSPIGRWGYSWGDTSACPGSNMVIVGMYLRGGAYLDGYQVFCNILGSNGVPQRGLGTFYGNWVGGTGGAVSLRECPVGQVVSGFQGNSGDVIDRLGPLCTSVEYASAGYWYVTSTAGGAPVGGNGGAWYQRIMPAPKLPTELKALTGWFNGAYVVKNIVPYTRTVSFSR